MNNEEQHQETQSQPSHPKLLPGVDYTVNQYTGDIVLLASGARKLITFYGYHAEPRLLKHLESLKPGQERVKYVVQVNLVDREDTVVSSGLGSCSSDESRHRYRWLTETRLAELGIQEKTLKDAPVIEKKGPEGAIKLRRVRNPWILDVDNTILKEAYRRAEVEAAHRLPGIDNILRNLAEDKEAEEAEQIQ